VFRVHVHVVGHVSSTCITKSSEDLKSGKEDPFLRIFAAEKNKHDSEIVRTRPPKYYHPPAPSTFWYPLLCLSHLSPPPLLLCWPRQCLLHRGQQHRESSERASLHRLLPTSTSAS
jgi:hypothetical protein